jgi:hypothetical protein
MVLMLAAYPEMMGAPVGSEVVAATTAAAVTPGVGMIAFELVNDSGYTLTQIWIAAQGSGAWQEVLGQGNLLPGGTIMIKRANPKGIKTWDLRVEYRDSAGTKKWEIFNTLDLAEIKKITIRIEKDGRWNTVW